MPRKPRFFLPDIPVHMIIRGNSRQAVFAENDDYLTYLTFMEQASVNHSCQIHAYVLMTNHVHILLSATQPENISKLSQAIGRKYVPYFNRKYQKTGTLWEGRFKASTIDSEYYLLACYRYIEQNPVRAGLVVKSKDYAWSSYHCNADEKKDGLVTPHLLYQKLGHTMVKRQANYQTLFETELSDDLIKDIRQSTQTGTPLGSKKFQQEIEKLLGKKVGYSTRGRPLSKK